MECVVVQDLFLNETAKYAHVFLPGSSFLEKDGTFTNAERRISRVRKVMEPLAGLAAQIVFRTLEIPVLLHATRTIRIELVDDVLQVDTGLASFTQRCYHRLADSEPGP